MDIDHHASVVSIDKLLIEAIESHKSNNFQAAEKLYKQILKHQPDHPDANHNLGVLAVQFGKPKLAIPFFQKALNKLPNNEQYKKSLLNAQTQINQNSNLKDIDNELTILFNQKKYDEAIKLAKISIDKHPEYFFGWKLLGTIYGIKKDYTNALPSLKKSLSFSPNDPNLHCNLGIVLKNCGKFEEAQYHYNQALTINPEYLEAHFNLANLLQEKGSFNDADKHYRKALSINPQYIDAYINLGNLLKSNNKPVEAKELYQKALDINPDNIDALSNLGNLLKESNNLKESEKYYRKALYIDPNNIDIHINLAILLNDSNNPKEAEHYYKKILKIKPDHAEAHRSLSLIIKYSKETPHIEQLHNLYNKIKNPQEKYRICFALAKAYDDIKDHKTSFKYLEEANYLKAQELQYSIEQTISTFKAIQDLFKNKKIKNIQLDTHSSNRKKAIFIVGMPRSGTTLTEQILSSHSNVYGCGELDFLAHSFYKNILTRENQDLKESAFVDFYNEYMDRIDNLEFKESVFTDKLPHNFIFIGAILEIFPDAKIVYMKRDPMAICWSMYKSYFPAQSLGYSFDLINLGKFYRLHTQMMEFWKELYNDKIYTLDYEELTQNNKEETKKLLEYCDLPFEEETLEPHKNKRAIFTASTRQVREKIYKGSSDVWKSYESFLEPLKTELSKTNNFLKT